MKRRASLILLALLVASGMVPAVAAEEGEEMIVMSHLGGSLAVNLEVVETVFFMEKDGRTRFHLVWRGNAEGKTIEGTEASEVWAKIRDGMKAEFLWVPHMGGTLGIARDAVTSVFFMPAKDGKGSTLRINYGTEAKTVEGAEAEALWATFSK